MRVSTRALVGICCAIVLASLSNRLALAADDVADFYRGKTVTIYIGSEAGGTYDLYARTIARFLGAHLPGNPTVVAQNMPGAASLQAAGYVYNVAPQDGTAIVAPASTMPFRPLVDSIAAQRIDPVKANWLPSPASYGVVMLVRSDLPVKSWEDMRQHEVVMAGIAPGQLNSILIGATNATLGTKIKAIMGHPSFNASMLALDRGEIDGYPSAPYDAMRRLYSKQLAAGKYRIVLQFGPYASPDYPDAPLVTTLLKTPDDRMLFDVAMGSLKVGYNYMMGPKVPADRVKAMRAAFEAVFKDKDFIADAERQTLSVEPVPGEEIQRIITETYALPKPVIERMREIYDHP